MSRTALQVVSTGGFYGAERALLELATYLKEQGWESHIVALEGHGTPELTRRATQCGLKATAFSDGRRLGAAALLTRLRALLAEHPRAIVHSHGYKPDILLAALRAPRRLGCLATCHTWYSDTVKMKLFERLDKRVLRGFDHVVAVSREIRDDLIASGVNPGNVSRIDNGISVPSVEPDGRARIRGELGIGPQERLVVQIGRLAKSKRNDLLLEAVADLRELGPIRVLLVGEGAERESLIAKAHSLGIAHSVTLCGYRDDAPRVLAAADVLALTSDKEGLPIVILEAMALGCPVVSTAVGDVPAVLRSGESGWIVPVNDRDALRRALAEALGDPDLARSRARQAQKDFTERFARDVMGRRYLELYERTWSARGWA